jgi:hypothetical protein
VEKLTHFWKACGSNVDTMDPEHHDRVLAIVSHLPHIIAYNIVGTADDLEAVSKSEVIKYSASGFRDFTRLAASDPTMWRDVCLSNRDAILEMLGRFSEDLAALQRSPYAGARAMICSNSSRARARSGARSSRQARKSTLRTSAVIRKSPKRRRLIDRRYMPEIDEGDARHAFADCEWQCQFRDFAITGRRPAPRPAPRSVRHSRERPV